MATPEDAAAAASLAQLLQEQSAQQREADSAVPLALDEALAYGEERLRDRVVVVTGAGSGFGRAYALKAAQFGAKLVLSDLNEASVTAVVKEIKAAGGEATGIRCNVVSWEEQVKMFRHGVDTYGCIDVVIVNAGIAEGGANLMDLRAGKDGEPSKPKTLTLDVNVTGAMYSTKLAFFHLTNNKNDTRPKSIVLLGSMASFFGLPAAPVYSTSKHAVLGMFRSLFYDARVHGISINCVNPWFAETNIFGAVPLLLLAGIPLAGHDDVVGAMMAASCKPKTCGSAFVVDFKGILEVPYGVHASGKDGYYGIFAKRAVGAIALGKWVLDCINAVTVAFKRGRLD
ncbi:hypothetical protein JCM10207_008281 [Rhodosporidiobolus poonsookiae]